MKNNCLNNDGAHDLHRCTKSINNIVESISKFVFITLKGDCSNTISAIRIQTRSRAAASLIFLAID